MTNFQKVLTVLVTACGTAALLLGGLVPRGVTAKGDSPLIRLQVPVPTLDVDGCRVRLETDRAEYAPGDQPVLRLTAENRSADAADLRIQLGIQASQPTSPLSRLVAVPRPLWTGEWAVDVPPGETRQVALPTGTELPGEQEISITMSGGDLAILAASPAVRQLP